MLQSYLLPLLVKAKVYSVKYQQAVAKVPSLNFSFFFLTKFSFLKVHFKSTGKKLCQFFMNKKVCISTSGKVG